MSHFQFPLPQSSAVVASVLAGLLLVFAGNSLLSSPQLWLFKARVGATEYGHWFALAAVGVAGWALFLRPLGARWAVLVMALAALVLLLRPAWLAWRIGRTLPGEFAVGMGNYPSTVGDFTSPSGGEESARVEKASVSSLAGETPAPPFAWLRLWLARAPEPVAVQSLVYAQTTGVELKLDFYPAQSPPGAPPAPCVLVLHGGGWENGERGEFAVWNHWLARRGYAVAAIDYRLAPTHRWPAQRDDTQAALRFLQSRAGELRLDPQRFVLMGRSAGGQIAEATAFARPAEPAIRGCLALYAPADLNFAYEYARNQPPDLLDSKQLMLNYLGGPPEDQAENYATSGAYHLLAKSGAPRVPTLLLHGVRDDLVWHRQSQRFAARLAANGVPHFYLSLPWATHAFDYNFHGPGGQLTQWTLDAFLDRVVPVPLRHTP